MSRAGISAVIGSPKLRKDSAVSTNLIICYSQVSLSLAGHNDEKMLHINVTKGSSEDILLNIRFLLLCFNEATLTTGVTAAASDVSIHRVKQR